VTRHSCVCAFFCCDAAQKTTTSDTMQTEARTLLFCRVACIRADVTNALMYNDMSRVAVPVAHRVNTVPETCVCMLGQPFYEWVHRWFHERIYECVAALMQHNTIIPLMHMLVSSLPGKWPLVLPFCYGYCVGAHLHLSTKNNTLCFAENIQTLFTVSCETQL
jgi:hypothetical protein